MDMEAVVWHAHRALSESLHVWESIPVVPPLEVLQDITTACRLAMRAELEAGQLQLELPIFGD